jgi:Raf kinase inhibitor-like YbhB/YbcL family protein
LALSLSALLAGCGGNNPSKELPDAAGSIRLTSQAFDDGATIPKRFSCSGEDVSPPLTIRDLPQDTRELALVVEDPNADRFVHWSVVGIPPDTAAIATGTVPPGAVQTENGFGDRRWGGPCPPEDDEPHRYVFALDAQLGLGGDASADEVRDALADHALARGTLTGLFGR